MPPLTPSATLIGSFFLLRRLFLLVAIAIRNTEFHEVLQNLFLSDLRCFVAGLLQHWCAAALNLARPQCRQDDKAIFAIDVIRNGNQARPPNDAIISSIRLCWRRGTALPLRTI